MATTEDQKTDNSELTPDDTIDTAIEEILSEKYESAHNLLTQEYPPSTETRNSDYRNPNILMNQLEKEFTDLLSAAAVGERYPSTDSIEETEERLKKQAEKYLDTE